MGTPLIASGSFMKSFPNDLLTLRKNGSTAESTFSHSSKSVSWSRSGVTNPSRLSQIEAVVQAGTDFSAWRESINSKSGSVDQYAVGNTSLVASDVFLRRNCTRANYPVNTITQASVNSVILTRANNLALSDLAQEIYDATTAFQSGTFIGELKDTIRTIRNPARALRSRLPDYLNAVTKNTKKARTRKEAALIASDTWLEKSFGWTPLINDISEATEIGNKLLVQPYKDLIRYGKSKEQFYLSSSTESAGTAQPMFTGRRIDTSTAQVYYEVCIRLGPENFGRLKELGLAPVDWLPTLWNLLPWSFVADYFTNIGDIITSLANCTVKTRWALKTTKQSITRKHVTERLNLWVDPRVSYAVKRVKHPAMEHSLQRFERTRYNGSFVPSLEFQLPGSGLKWINLSALGTQLLFSRRSINNRFS